MAYPGEWLLLVARVSDPEQVAALPAQRKRLLAYAQTAGLPYKYVEFDETAFKGERKRFAATVTKPVLKARGNLILVFDKIDRFTRDASSEEKGFFVKRCKAGKIELRFPSDNLYLHSESPAPDYFRLDIGVALSAYYSGTIRDNVKRVFEERIEDQHEWMGRAMVGYVNYDTGVRRPNSKRTVKSIKADVRYSGFVRLGFELRARGLSYEAITQRLREEGMVSISKRSPIRKAQVVKFLNNPFYAGQMLWKGKLYPHKYERIIEPWLWRQSQEEGRRRSVERTKYGEKPFLYRDILRCRICGCTVSTDGPKQGKYYYVKCTESNGKHGAKWINEWVVTAQVVARVFAPLRIPESAVPGLMEEIKNGSSADAQYYRQRRRELRAERSSLDEDIKSMFRDRSSFNIPADLFNQLVADKTLRQGAIDTELERLDGPANAILVPATNVVKLSTMAGDLFTNVLLNLEDRRRLLRMVLKSNMTWDGENIDFEYRNPFSAVTECQKTNLWCPLVYEFRTACRGDLLDIASELGNLVEDLG